jgi:hypothetical protein
LDLRSLLAIMVPEGHELLVLRWNQRTSSSLIPP